jgi:hypothetical protein
VRHPWLWLTLAAAVLSTGAAADWPRFRGPNGSGVSNSAGVPVEFGPSRHLVWKTPVPFGRSSPVLAGDRIFITASEGDALITMCLDRPSGRVIWRKDVMRTRVTPAYKLNDAASPTPVTDGTNVFVFFPDVGLISFGPDGAERWRLPLGPFDTFYGLGASPILVGDTLLLVCDARTNAFLIAVDAGSGRVRWRAARRETHFEGHASPVVWEPKGEPPQIIVLGVNRIEAYDVATGERKWWLNGLAFLPVASPVVGPEVVIVRGVPEIRHQQGSQAHARRDGRLGRVRRRRHEPRRHHRRGGVERASAGGCRRIRNGCRRASRQARRSHRDRNRLA